MKTLKCNYLSNNAKPGMTLIEVLVSVAVIGIGCLAVITVHISSLKSKIMADNMNLAKTIAVTELERLKTLEFNEALNSANTEVNKLDHLGRPCLENQVCPNHIFTRKVRFYPKTPTSMSCQVEIEVNWRDSFGRGPHSLLYSSVLTSPSFFL